jgi:hypothetical protein
MNSIEFSEEQQRIAEEILSPSTNASEGRFTISKNRNQGNNKEDSFSYHALPKISSIPSNCTILIKKPRTVAEFLTPLESDRLQRKIQLFQQRCQISPLPSLPPQKEIASNNISSLPYPYPYPHTSHHCNPPKPFN